MRTKIILIRHGQTDWNRERRYQGHADTALNAVGIRQAKLAARRLRKESIDKVCSSSSRRAFDFAEIALKGYSIEKALELREMNFGAWEGLTHEEILQRYPAVYSGWISNPFSAVIPGGETFPVFSKRVMDSFERIARPNGHRAVAVVTHAGPIRVILNRFLRLDDIWKIKTDSGSIHVIEFKDRVGGVVCLNDTTYLNDG